MDILAKKIVKQQYMRKTSVDHLELARWIYKNYKSISIISYHFSTFLFLLELSSNLLYSTYSFVYQLP
jgi:hypothetical protein